MDAVRGLAAVAVVIYHTGAVVRDGGFPAAEQLYAALGGWLEYLFRGSSIYFFIISGFVISSVLPKWRSSSANVLWRGLRRVTRIVVVFWLALAIVGVVNGLKGTFFGQPWYAASTADVVSEMFLASNFFEREVRLIPSGWYLEADIVLFLLTVLTFWCWTVMPNAWRPAAQRTFWLGTIPLAAFSLFVESECLMSRGVESPLRALAYFLIGVLGAQASLRRLPLLCLLAVSMLFLVYNDHTEMHQYFCTTGAVLAAWFFVCSNFALPVREYFARPVFGWLSRVSFSVFIFNLFFLTIWISLARHLVPASALLLGVWMIAGVVPLYALCWCFHRYLETPVLKWHDSFWKPQTGGKSPPETLAAAPAAVEGEAVSRTRVCVP